MHKAKSFSAKLLIFLLILAAVPAVASDPDNCTTCPMDQSPPPPDAGGNCFNKYCWQETTYSADGHTVTVEWKCICYGG
jgi:hypothetical protein